FLKDFGASRVAYFPNDIDRTFGEIQNEDHLKVLRNTVEWAMGGEQPLVVAGPGLLDVAYWRQEKSLTANLVNLTNPMAMKGVLREIYPVEGPFRVSMELPEGARVAGIKLL